MKMSDFFHSEAQPPSRDFISPPEGLLEEIKPLTYEDSLLKRLADDVKAPFEKQLKSVEDISRSAHEQAEASVRIADNANERLEVLKKQLELALKEADSAKKAARESRVFSIAALWISAFATVAAIIQLFL